MLPRVALRRLARAQWLAALQRDNALDPDTADLTDRQLAQHGHADQIEIYCVITSAIQ
jgi:hypothetical protein